MVGGRGVVFLCNWGGLLFFMGGGVCFIWVWGGVFFIAGGFVFL